MDGYKRGFYCEKRFIIYGLGFFFLGLVMLLISVLNDGDGVLGRLSIFSGGFMGAGLATLSGFFYWNRPGKVEMCAEKQKKEKVLLHDERKIALRDRAGYLCFLINLGVIWALPVILIFFISRWLNKKY